jgi:hypothetical protein
MSSDSNRACLVVRTERPARLCAAPTSGFARLEQSQLQSPRLRLRLLQDPYRIRKCVGVVDRHQRTCLSLRSRRKSRLCCLKLGVLVVPLIKAAHRWGRELIGRRYRRWVRQTSKRESSEAACPDLFGTHARDCSEHGVQSVCSSAATKRAAHLSQGPFPTCQETPQKSGHHRLKEDTWGVKSKHEESRPRNDLAEP